MLSANVHRRNLTAGQRAMAVAMLQPEAEQAHRGKKVSRNGTLSDVPSNRVAEARGVLSHSSELAEAVMRGEKPLQAALAEARHSQGSARHPADSANRTNWNRCEVPCRRTVSRTSEFDMPASS